MNIGIALSGDQSGVAADDRRPNRVSAFAAALYAYKFLFRHFWSALRLLLLPIVAAGLVLYVTLSIYLEELLAFIEAPNPRVASLALGTLTAGLFLSLFCYAIGVVAISNLALGKPPRGAGLHFKAERQEWRVYAAYLRFLLLLSVVFVSVYLLSAYVAPLLMFPERFSAWLLTLVCVIGVTWLVARIGFLVAPVVAAGEGSVLRKARQESARDLWRNCILMALLLVPGVLVQFVGEYVFRMGAGALRVARTLPLADSARSMREMLGSFLAVISLSLFVTIILLTVGAIAAYQTKRFLEASEGGMKPVV